MGKQRGRVLNIERIQDSRHDPLRPQRLENRRVGLLKSKGGTTPRRR